MNQSTDLSELFSLRANFTIVALTGRTGSGCTTIARQIEKGFEKDDYPVPTVGNHNSFRKYKIIYNFSKENFKPYKFISYRDILTLFILKYPLNDFIAFIERIASDIDYSAELKKISEMSDEFVQLAASFKKIDLNSVRDDENLKKLYTFFFSKSFILFSDQFHEALKLVAFARHNVIFQEVGNNIRKSGNPYDTKEADASNIFAIALMINMVIKAIRNVQKNEPAKIVIDSLRNPLEVMYFKQRYAAFYLIAVNRDDKTREKELAEKFAVQYNEIRPLLEEEYKGGQGVEFYKQYVRSCIEKADIHLTFRTENEVSELNNKLQDEGDNTSPFFSWEMQLLKYMSLIEKPGLITPSPEERAMQLAYTAKYNSGCISRQVGAAITDAYYSVKAIGWNNTPEGQVPCLLRNTKVLLESYLNPKEEHDRSKMEEYELAAFTPYEKDNKVFRRAVIDNYDHALNENSSALRGRSVCMCFKSLQNSCVEGKNQVHTRSLHAEESAFLQITKYGGEGIKGGKLFTTASPCELCAKKAYQLGIKVIYYVDPYPGISQEQILDVGPKDKRPEVRLFNGAIGNAYHWLYEPFMAYKDELSLLLGLQIEDITAKQKSLLQEKEFELETYKKRVSELEKKLDISKND